MPRPSPPRFVPATTAPGDAGHICLGATVGSPSGRTSAAGKLPGGASTLLHVDSSSAQTSWYSVGPGSGFPDGSRVIGARADGVPVGKAGVPVGEGDAVAEQAATASAITSATAPARIRSTVEGRVTSTTGRSRRTAPAVTAKGVYNDVALQGRMPGLTRTSVLTVRCGLSWSSSPECTRRRGGRSSTVHRG